MCFKTDDENIISFGVLAVANAVEVYVIGFCGRDTSTAAMLHVARSVTFIFSYLLKTDFTKADK